MSLIDTLKRDARDAVRALGRNKAATAVSIAALALGIAVNASSFIPISSIILHPLPYPNLDRIMTLWEAPAKSRGDQLGLSPATFDDIRRQTRSFEKVGAYRYWSASLTGGTNAERIRSCLVSPEFFDVLGTAPERGRFFRQGERNVIVVSHAFWTSHLASVPDAIGSTLTLDGASYTITGIMPDRFDFPLDIQIWAPLALDPALLKHRETHELSALALLKTGISPGEASNELAGLGARLARQYPATNNERTLVSISLTSLLTEKVTNGFLFVLVAAALFVLLLACANVANLQLAVAASRQKETAVRAALGASQVRIARQLVLEGILMSAAAGILGLVLASWNNEIGKQMIPPNAFRFVAGLRSMRIDTTVTLLTVAVSVLAGVLCSLPAILQHLFRSMRADLSDVLRERSAAALTGASRSLTRSALVVFEMVCALVLLISAGLMVQTFHALLDRYQGYDPKSVMTLQLNLPAAGYSRDDEVVSFYDRALAGLSSVPGVSAPAIASDLGRTEKLFIQGRPDALPGEPLPRVYSVSSQYFDALHIPILAGRGISRNDRSTSAPVVVISQLMARHYWPDTNPIGRHIRFAGNPQWLMVVGVSGDIVEDWFHGTPSPGAYISYAQFPHSFAQIDVRTARDPVTVAPALRAVLTNLDRQMPIYDVKTLEEAEFEARGGVYAAARTMSGYAIVALILAATGIYGIVSFFVAARTHEIGIRMALGATRAGILAMTLGQTVRFLVAAVIIGVPLTVLLARTMSHVLFGVVHLNPITFATFTVMLIGVALIASYWPSHRATRIDPMTALRDE
ncbi:MAG: ABC transporter permease [Acidobacteriaceae bacterium]|nr:ABC transporter permease [Acidobacteriaceae bacterium]